MKLRAALATAGFMLGSVGAASAQALSDLPRADPVAIELGTAAGDRWLPAHEMRRAARLRGPALDGAGPMQLRWGVDLRRTDGDSVHPFVGLGLAAGRRTTLYYEQGMPEDAAALPSRSTPAGNARLGLEIRRGSRSSAWREFGTLRMQIDVHTRVALKPRRGGATITYHKQF